MSYPQYSNQPQFPGPYQPMPQQRTSGMAVAGMVLGIITVVGWWIPIGSVVLGALAVALSGVGMAQTGNPASGYSGRGLAITGLVCGIIGLVPSVFFTIAFLGTVH
ncbi:DUF4190 domain-containing protein [Labedaea rhizosphaerae]|uniref:DUF4190 domain-containing protein n=1 Tax=Labedaea rhizosphaerae TaxID=598644 RepID=A0A4R6SE20_LABRH|nr:DUF4190 domain-containing protein [Labedaea rhizosphaerae]TDP97893.1 hypothetical protein EV186_103872 [Labedaea rhizosphaerae]